jgi:hypothetical protein
MIWQVLLTSCGVQDSCNNLKSDFHVGDGVHLSSDGYQVWIRELKRALNNAYKAMHRMPKPSLRYGFGTGDGRRWA